MRRAHNGAVNGTVAEDDPFGLARFVAAQRHAYEGALAELRAARKTGHWIWFVFPQVAGLGRSEVSRHYAIRSLDEARAYLAHPVLGPRLRECADLVLAAPRGATALSMLGAVDALKLRSSMTLFLRAEPGDPRWQRVLDRFWGGVPDALTDGILTAGPA